MIEFKINKKFLYMLKLIISLGLIVYLLFLIDWNKAFNILKESQKIYLIIAFFLLLFGIFFASLRWHLILKDNNIKFSVIRSYKGYLRGLFYNIFMPGVVGGDVVRIGICRFQADCKLGTATASVILERILGVFSLFVFLFLSHAIFFDKFLTGIDLRLLRYLIIIGLLFIIFFIVLVLSRYRLMKWLQKKDFNGLMSFVSTGIIAFCSVRMGTFLIVLFLSSLFQSVDIFACFLFSRAIGIQLSLPIFFGIIPLVYFVTVLPVSLGGLGVREGAFVFLFSAFGVGTTEAITLSFLVYFNRVIYGAAGGIVEFLESFKIKKMANITSQIQKE